MKKRKDIGFEALSKLICDAIEDEPFFTKQVLIPKVRALVSAFATNLNLVNYSKYRGKSEFARLLRSHQLLELEMRFWKQKLRDNVEINDMEKYYAELDNKRLEWQDDASNNSQKEATS